MSTLRHISLIASMLLTVILPPGGRADERREGSQGKDALEWLDSLVRLSWPPLCPAPCPHAQFRISGRATCRPWLNCSEVHRLQVTTLLGQGAVKSVWKARMGAHVVALSRPRSRLYRADFRHGVDMLTRLQPSRHVTRFFGRCDADDIFVNEYHPLGHAGVLPCVLDNLHHCPPTFVDPTISNSPGHTIGSATLAGPATHTGPTTRVGPLSPTGSMTVTSFAIPNSFSIPNRSSIPVSPMTPAGFTNPTSPTTASGPSAPNAPPTPGLGLARCRAARRLGACVSYAEVIAFLHDSPLGTRIMCDTNDLHKTLTQFLITDDLRLVANDLDALPEVLPSRKIRCGKRRIVGEFSAPEQRWVGGGRSGEGMDRERNDWGEPSDDVTQRVLSESWPARGQLWQGGVSDWMGMVSGSERTLGNTDMLAYRDTDIYKESHRSGYSVDELPGYDEKTDVWKMADVCEYMLGGLEAGVGLPLRLHLFALHRACKQRDPRLRPSAAQALREYRRVWDTLYARHCEL